MAATFRFIFPSLKVTLYVWHHLPRQYFLLLELVKHRVQHHVLRSRLHQGTEFIYTLRFATPDGHTRSHIRALVAHGKPLPQTTFGTGSIRVHGDIDTFRNRKRRRVTASFVQALPEDLNMLHEVGRGRAAGAHPPIAVAYRAFQSDSRPRAKPQRRMRFLPRFGFHGHVLELPKVTLDRSPGLHPQRFEHLQPFHELTRTALARDTKDCLRYVSAANAYANNEPSLTQLIQRGQALS